MQLLPALSLTRGYVDFLLPNFLALNSSYITKHLIAWPLGNSQFCFLSNLDVSTLSQETTRFSGKQNRHPKGPVTKCILFLAIIHVV